MPPPDYESYAAIDLGSNSFHMLVANYHEGRLQVIDRLKEMVQLAGGLTEDNLLSQEAMDRGIACLEKFGQRIQEIHKRNIRAVGTNTLRQARNGSAFLKRARKALGCSIEIISGREEARLVYLGVANTVFNETEERLIVDIGGGSTEVVIGRGFETRLTESLYMGCINMSKRFFQDGSVTAKKMRKAILFARQELEAIESIYKKQGWDTALGSSGTILTVNQILRAEGWSNGNITGAGLDKLRKQLSELGHVDNFSFPSLSANRAPVFAGGVAILSAIFDAFALEQMTASEGALREGLLYDLIGRTHERDIRNKSIESIANQYQVDQEQAKRVMETARVCFHQVRDKWSLQDTPDLQLLTWAARLHEVGLSIAHSQYQKHGAYLINHSELPGFSREEQSELAMLIRCHRRKFPLDELRGAFEENLERMLRLSILLRIAIVMNRSRSSNPLPPFAIKIKNGTVKLEFPDKWLENHPLTEADLEVETGYLKDTGVSLEYR